MAAEQVRVLLTAETVAERVAAIGRQISADYAGRQPILVGVLKGAFVFMADLVRHLSIPVRCDFVMLSSYGQGTESSGKIELRLDTSIPAKEEHLLLIEDIVDTGTTIPWLLEHLGRKEPASIKVCALLDKPARRRVPVTLDYVGFTIPDRFVVGYGIDYAERHRELPEVAYIAQS